MPSACGAAPRPAIPSIVTTSGASTTLTRAAIEVGMPGQLRVDGGRVADQRDADIEVRERGQRAIDDLTRGVIAAHGIDCDPDHQVQGSACLGRIDSSGTARAWRPR